MRLLNQEVIVRNCVRRWAVVATLCLGIAGCDWGCPEVVPSEFGRLDLERCSATPTSGVVPLVVSFTARATEGEFEDYRFNWFFGDGGTAGATVESELTTPRAASHMVAHTYTSAGTFVVTMTVSNGEEALTCNLQVRANVTLSR